jgi:hypothetical protein
MARDLFRIRKVAPAGTRCFSATARARARARAHTNTHTCTYPRMHRTSRFTNAGSILRRAFTSFEVCAATQLGRTQRARARTHTTTGAAPAADPHAATGPPTWLPPRQSHAVAAIRRQGCRGCHPIIKCNIRGSTRAPLHAPPRRVHLGAAAHAPLAPALGHVQIRPRNAGALRVKLRDIASLE